MTIEDIYSKVANHMIKGIMMHEQLANYYDFLGLGGYKRCHEYHYLDEICAYRGLCRYFINHHNKLVPYSDVENPDVIPSSWYNHVRQDVDANTKKSAVRNGMQKWVDWERETKKLYEESYQELIEIGEIASACKIKELICDVDCELKKAERYMLNKEAIGYDMGAIIAEQHDKHKKYARKMKEEISVKLC